MRRIYRGNETHGELYEEQSDGMFLCVMRVSNGCQMEMNHISEDLPLYDGEILLMFQDAHEIDENELTMLKFGTRNLGISVDVETFGGRENDDFGYHGGAEINLNFTQDDLDKLGGAK